MVMKQTHSLFTLLFALLFACTACNDNPPAPLPTGTLSIDFAHLAGSEQVVPGPQVYTNALGESFNIDVLQYYISNIVLKQANGTEWAYPQDSSYFLIKAHEPASKKIQLRNVPAGDYTEIAFMIGVDSLRNTMDVSRRTGVLDIGGEGSTMYWNWNSGYIFFKMEGSSPQAPADNTGQNKYRYHVGLFGGYNTRTLNNTRVKTLPFNGQRAQVGPGHSPSVYIDVDVLQLFSGTPAVSIAEEPSVMTSPYSARVADSFVHLFSFNSIHSEH
jgi:hypothetical protein